MKKPSESGSIGAALELTRWDYSPADTGVGLLSPMSRYFRGFPWEGRRGDEAVTRAQEEPEGGLGVEDLEGS